MRRNLIKREDPLFDIVNLFESFGNLNPNLNIQKQFTSNIREEDDKYLVDIEAPGMSRDDISIEINDGFLTISGKRELKNEVKKEDYIVLESSFGSFERKFKLPKDVNPENIDAKFENGLVELILPKEKELSTVKKIELK
jgi:HSP20 family protein